MKLCYCASPKKGVRTKTDHYGNPGDRYTTQSIDPHMIDLFRGGKWISINMFIDDLFEAQRNHSTIQELGVSNS